MPFGLKTTKADKKPKEAGEKMEVGGAEDMEVGQPDSDSIKDSPKDQQTNTDLQKSNRESEGRGGKETTQPEAMDTQGHEVAREGDGDPDNTEKKAEGNQGNEDSKEALVQTEGHGAINQETEGKHVNEDSQGALCGTEGNGDPNGMKKKAETQPQANTRNVKKQKAEGKQENEDPNAASGRPAGRGGRNIAKQNTADTPNDTTPKITGVPSIEEQFRNQKTKTNQQQHNEVHIHASEGAYGQTHGHDHDHRSRGHGHSQRPGQSYSHGHATGDQWGMHSTRDQQMQDQLFREAQASKQMVYEVYGNCITMLEEMESRELKKKGHKALPRSDIYLPDQNKFDDKTIQRKVDTQLILLQCQLVSCHEKIRDEVKEDLKEITIDWCSQREDKKIPDGLTDDYTQKLFELLETGKTNHPKEFSEPPTIGEKDMQNALGAIMQGQQKQSDLDNSFKKDPKKKATGPKIRKTAGIDKGADRIVKGRPEFEKAVDNHRTSIR